MNINQHFSNLAAKAAAEGADASQLISQRERLFKDKVIPELTKRGANDTAIVQAREKWYSQTDKVMQSAGLLPKAGQSSRSFAKDKRADKANQEAVKTGSNFPIIKEAIVSTGETIGNLFGQGVGSTIESAAGFVRDIGENERDSISAKLANYGKNLRKEYEGSASTFQNELQAGKHGKVSQLSTGAIQSVPAMIAPFGAAKGVVATAGKIPALKKVAPYLGLGAGVVTGHTQNYGEVRRNATENLARDFPSWEKLQGNPLFEKNFQDKLNSGLGINQARQQAHAQTLDTLSEQAANKYGSVMTAIDFIAPSGAVLGSGILKNAPTSQIGKKLVGGGVDSSLVKREMQKVPRTGMAKLVPDVSLAANKAAAKMVGKQALEEGLQGGIGEYGAQAASANIGGTPVDYGKVGKTILEEGLVGGIMGGGMQSATGGSPTSQAKEAAKQLRNQTNTLRQEEAAARKELADAMQLNDPAALQSAQDNLNNIGAEAAKVKAAYDQYGIDTPYFVERFAAQYQPQQQQAAQQGPAAQPQPTSQPQPAPQAAAQPQPTPTAPFNQGMANTTNLVMDSISNGFITPEEAQAIQTDPIRADVFTLTMTGDVAAAHNAVMNAVSLGNIDTDQAQELIQSITRYSQAKAPKKPSVSSIVNNHVKQQIHPQDKGLFSNPAELDPNTFEPIDPNQPSPFQEDFNEPKEFHNAAKANDYVRINGLTDSHDIEIAEDGTIVVFKKQGIIPDDPNLNDFDYKPKNIVQPTPADPNLSNFSEGPVSIDSLNPENVPDVLDPKEPQQPVQPTPTKQPDHNKPKTFTNYVRANDYLKSNGLKDSHEIIKKGEGQIIVQPKSAAPGEDFGSDQAFDDMLNAVPPIGTPTQNSVKPVQAADPATDFDSDEAFDELLSAVPPSGKQTDPAQPTASFADQIRDAHLNNPKAKPKLINDEVAKGRPRPEVLKEVADVVKSVNDSKPKEPELEVKKEVEKDLSTSKEGSLLAEPAPSEIVERIAMPKQVSLGMGQLKTTPIDKPVYREMNLEGFEDLVRDTLLSSGSTKNLFVTDNIDLALGQGGNKGILVQLRGDAVSGKEHKKPMSGDLTGREYKTDFLSIDSIDQFILPKDTKLRSPTRRGIQGQFTYKKLDDGSILATRKGVTVQPLNEMRLDSAEPQQDQKTGENGIQENDAPDNMKSGDIGRKSDNQPFANKSAATTTLKNQGLENSHEVVQLAPSSFVLRQTQEALKAQEPQAAPIQPEQNQEKAKDPLAFPIDKVKEAYGHAHLSPGNTARSFKESFDKFIQAETDDAQALATTEAQQTALDDAINWVKESYINEALPPLLNAASATVSSARAGRNNFNSKQADQRGSALDKATAKFDAELERLKGYAKLKVLAARTPKQKQADAEAEAQAQAEKDAAEQAKVEAKIKADAEAKANKKRASNEWITHPDSAEHMTMEEWKAIGKDYKGITDGVRRHMGVPVWITDEGKSKPKNQSNDVLKVGDTITFSEVFDYALPNEPYTIVTAAKAKITLQSESGGQFSFNPNILAIEKAKNPDLYKIDSEKTEPEQPAQPTEKPQANNYETVRKQFDAVTERLDDGDESLTLDEVKAAYKALMDNQESLVSEFSSQTKQQLLDKMHPYYAAMYKSHKKDELVSKWVSNTFRAMDFASGGVVTISYGDKRTMPEIVRDKIEAATQEDLNKYLEEQRQAKIQREKDLEAAEAGMNDPKTMDDFKRIYANGDFKDFKDFYRSLTIPQQALYDELKSDAYNEQRMQEIERNKAYREASNPSHAVESTTEATLFAGKHTKKGTDIWTVALNGRVDGDAFNDYRSQAKDLGGYYSSYKGGGAVPGFIFDNEATANEFLNLVTGDHEAKSTDPEPEAIAVDPQAEVEVIETDAKRQADKLREKAQAVIDRGEQNINRDRKTNTAKRAGDAARAEERANSAIFLGETLNRIADGIENGSVKYLSRLGAMTQLSHLESLLQRASYDQQRETNAKEREITATTIAYAEFPQYKTWTDSFNNIRSDLKAANPRLAEKLEKTIGIRYHNAYARWLNETNEFGTENYVGQLARKSDGSPAVFKTNIKQAETLVKASNKRAGKDSFEVFKIKNGEYAVISSYETAMENGSWKPTNSDKQMTLTNEFGSELYNALKQYKRKNPSYYMNWLIESMHDSVSRMEKLGIHDPATFRAAMREYLSLRSKEKANDPIKEMERSMIGRSNDGLDFFPTPRNVVEQMIEMADLDSDMKVLEPSAGMGHIADVLKDHGIKPDVIELSGKRQDLLKLKGYSVVGNDFLMFDPKNRAPNYGDVFKTADGKYQGVMRGSGSLGSNRVRLMREDDGQMITYFDRDELELVKMNGINYDRIIMNPPFSDRRDAAHIYHAFDLLADDGVMVAIAGEGVFFGKDKAAKEFQDWLDQVGAEITPLDAGTFNDPSLPVTTGVKARIIKINKADSSGKRFSRSEDLNQVPAHVKENTSGSTPDQIRTELVNRFGEDAIQQLEQKGILSIVPTHTEQGVEGFAENGRVTLIADAITAENIVPVFLHELGGHVGMQGVLKASAYDNLMSEFNRLVKSGNPDAIEAKRLAERESDAQVQADEYLPYLITVAARNQQNQGSAQKLINRVLSAVKAWAVDKLGLNLKLNSNDMVALAERMIKTISKGTPPTPPKGGTRAPSANKLIDRSNQTKTPAFKSWFNESKVVDSNGNPLIMYHGTPKSFNQFNTNESGALLGKGSYFTADNFDAAAYAGNKKPMQTYLSIQNPYYVNSVMDKVPSRQELKDLGHDGVILLNEDKTVKWAVVHKPNQIKSVTMNNGDFDSNNPDIRYSRSSTANPQNMSRSKQRELLDKAASTAFGQLSLRGAEASKTLSNRTLNLFQTMLHKSLRDETGQFKKTFDLVQGKINHVTFASSKSMDVAPSILTQLEEGGDYWKEVKRVGRTMGHTLSGGKIDKAKVDKDLKRIGDLMFENTLLDNSERHTVKELKQLGFDDDQIGLYNEIRDAIDTSLDTFANTTFSNIYKHLGGTNEEVLELAGQDLDITDHYNEILKRIDTLTKGKPEKSEARQAAIEAVDRVFKKANDLKDQGYVPLMRFGKYFVRIWNPTTGEVSYRQHFESESERNIYFRDQEKKGNLPPGTVLEKGQINELQHKLFQGVSPETVALFAKESGLPIGDAETAYIKYAVQNNHALKRLLKRQGIDGFDTDVKRVLASFVMSNARYSANQSYNPAIDESITNIEDPAFQEDAIRLRDYSLDTQEELAAVKNFAFVWYMGFSAMFGVVNLTQPLLQTFPYLMQYSKDHSTIFKAMGKAITTWAKGTDAMDPKYKAYYERARKEGHLDPQNTWMMQGLERGKSGLGASTWQLVSHASGLFAQASETVNRRTSLFAALDVAESMGQNKLEKLGFKDAYDFAVRTIQETQGIYNKGNRPRVSRGNVGSVLMMYKQFMIAYIEQMVRMQKSGLYGGEDDEFKKKMAALVGFGVSRSVLTMLGILMALSGTTGLPFVRDILDGIETAGGLVGKPVNTEREIQIALHDALGQTMGSAVNTALMDGIVNLNPLIDVKGRMGMGDLIPATAYFSPTTSDYMKSSEISQIAGPIGGLLEKVKESVALAQVGAYGQSGVQLLPKAITSVGQGAIAATTGDYRNMKTGVKTNDVTPWEGVIKILDAQPASIAKEGRVRGYEMKDKSAQTYVNARWKERYVNALESGDHTQVRTVKQEIREYNKSNPRYPVKFNQKLAETNFKKSNQSWQEKRKTVKGLEWMSEYNPYLDQ